MRRGATHRSERYQIADLLVDPGRQRVMRGDTEIALPKLSFELLLALLRVWIGRARAEAEQTMAPVQTAA